MQVRIYIEACSRAFDDDSGSLVQRFQCHTVSDSSNDVKSLQRLDSAIELLRLRQLLPHFVEALLALEVLPAQEVSILKRGLEPTISIDFVLDDAPAALEKAKQLLGSLTTSQIAFVAELHSQGEVIDFLRSFEASDGSDSFDARATFVTQQVQGGVDFDVDLINVLIAAQRWLRPFCATSRPVFESQSILNSHLRCIAENARELDAHTLVVRNLSLNMGRIKTLFAVESTRALLANIRDIMPTARFLSTLEGSVNGAALLLEYTPSGSRSQVQLMSEASVCEMVRQAHWVLMLANERPDDQNEIERFVKVFAAADRLHRQRLLLQRFGHPDYTVTSTSKTPVHVGQFYTNTGATEQDLLRITDELDAIAGSWQNALHCVMRRSRRFLLLDKAQVVRFVKACSVNLSISPRTPSASAMSTLAASLLPYVLLCFPEALHVKRQVEGVLIDVLSQVIGSHKHAQTSQASSLGVSSSELLERAERILHCVAVKLAPLVDQDDERLSATLGTLYTDSALSSLSSSSLCISESPQDRHIAAVGDELPVEIQSAVANCEGLSDDEIYRFAVSYLATGNGGRMPSPVQLMVASGSSTSADIEAFILRGGAFPGLCFAVVGVDALTVPVRETLLRALLTSLGRRARVALIFKTPMGMSSLSLVVKSLDVPDRALIPKSSDVRKYIGDVLCDVTQSSRPEERGLFACITLVAGESGCGKTHWIRRQLEGIVLAPVVTSVAGVTRPRWLMVTVHDFFDVGRLIEDYHTLVQLVLKAAAPTSLVRETHLAAQVRPVIGLHFNLSAAAVPDVGRCRIASAFHALFTQGLMLDEFSGTASMLDCRVQHAIFIELPALKAWPPVMQLDHSLTVAHHPWLQCGRLAALAVARTAERAVHSGNTPHIFDSPADAFAAGVLRVLLAPAQVPMGNSQSGLSDFLLRNAPSRYHPPAAAIDPETSSVFDKLWASSACTGLGRTHMARRMFVRLWASRSCFLHALRQHHASATRSGISADPIVRAYDKVPGFYERIGFILLEECIRLCDTRLRHDWSHPESQHAWSIRGSDFGRFKLICLAADVSETHLAPLSAQELRDPRFRQLDWEVFVRAHVAHKVANLGDLVVIMPFLNRLHAAHTSSAPESERVNLHNMFASAFGQSEGTIFRTILARQQFALSADFAIKLLILNERRRVGANVILCGDTGVGKSGVHA